MADRHNSMPVSSAEILKGIPCSAKIRFKIMFPFAKMEPGDCFFTENKSVSGSASAYAKKVGGGVRFATRSNYEHEGKTGYMCWRVL